VSLVCVWLVANKVVLAWDASVFAQRGCWNVLHSVLTTLYVGKKECLVTRCRIFGTVLYVFMFSQQNSRQNYNIDGE
jgi:hypothetical protein